MKISPQGLLGFTRFNSQGVEAIVVAKAPDDEGTKAAERRLRTTLQRLTRAGTA